MPSGEGVAVVTQAASALPTLAQLRALVYAPLRDSERSFIESWFVDAMLNEGYIDLCSRLRIKKVESSATADSSGDITFPTDMVYPYELWFGDVAVQFTDDATFDWFAQQNAPITGILARVSSTKIETFPAQTSESYMLRYYARPTTMTSDTSTPDELTLELTPRIVNYARAHAKWQEGEMEEGNQYMAMYEEGLPARVRNANRYRPGPLTVIPEISPMEM